jgi:hypothetical protein
MHGVAVHREVVTGEVGGCVHVHRYHDEEHRRRHFGDAFYMRYPALRRPVRTFSKLDGCTDQWVPPHAPPWWPTVQGM